VETALPNPGEDSCYLVSAPNVFKITLVRDSNCGMKTSERHYVFMLMLSQRSVGRSSSRLETRSIGTKQELEQKKNVKLLHEKDMAEACGSRTHHPGRGGQDQWL